MVGAFYDGVQVAPGQYPGALVVEDFNGDGRPDPGRRTWMELCGIGSQSPRPFGSAQGRLCRRKRDEDGAPHFEPHFDGMVSECGQAAKRNSNGENVLVFVLLMVKCKHATTDNFGKHKRTVCNSCGDENISGDQTRYPHRGHAGWIADRTGTGVGRVGGQDARNVFRQAFAFRGTETPAAAKG